MKAIPGKRGGVGGQNLLVEEIFKFVKPSGIAPDLPGPFSSKTLRGRK